MVFIATHQSHQTLATVGLQPLECLQRVVEYGHGHALAHVDLPRPSAPGALDSLSLLDALEAPLLLCQRGLELLVFVVFLEALRGELIAGGGVDGLAEVLAAQLAHQGQPRRGEQHLLPDLGRVRDVADGDEPGRRVVALEEEVEWLRVGEGGEDMGVDVVGESGGR